MNRTAIIATSVALLFATCGHAAREGGIAGDLSPGVRASFKHRIIVEQETWPSSLMETREGRVALELEARGGFRLHVRVRENPGDYVVCIVYVEGGGRVVLDEASSFIFHYEDRSVESTEILLTDSIEERSVWSTSDSAVVLRDDSSMYAKVRSGGYLTIVRFPRGSLPGGGGWVPGSFELRGGECDAYAQG
ncbi:MAG: hypothetical protein ABIG03_06960 [Candidatus Eisenbacteria bacterium]